jgi:hypothetical protein
MTAAWARRDAAMTESPGYFELASSKGIAAALVIRSPRERNLLDIMQRSVDLMQKTAILDLSQTIGRSALRTDGLVPALGTSSSRHFVPSSSAFLSSRQCLLMQGHELLGLDVCRPPLTEEDVHHLAGNAMCVPVVGAVLAASLALLAPQ